MNKLIFIELFITCNVLLFRVLKHLGCPHGCADGQRGPAAEFLRTQCQNILAKLNRASSKQFKHFLRDYVKYNTLTDILDFFHAYVGYCIDPNSLLSPLSKSISSLVNILVAEIFCYIDYHNCRFACCLFLQLEYIVVVYCNLYTILNYV